MQTFVAILILVPTAAALLLVALYIIGATVSFLGAGVDAAVVRIRQRRSRARTVQHRGYGRPALHH